MTILGIDPSYTRTGVCINKDGALSFKTISVATKSVYAIEEAMTMARKLSRLIYYLIEEHSPDIVAIEYPILATRSGAYLGLIQQAIYDRIRNNGYKGTYILFPSQAINSVTKNKSKTKSHIITWIQDYMNEKTKINHDEASAGVVTKLVEMVKTKEYKNSYILMNLQ